MGINEIRNRTLSPAGQAKIHALAGNPGAAVEDPVPPPPPSDDPVQPGPANPINDVEFYGVKVMEFYEYFSNKASQSTAANLTLAAATLKASVVLGGLIKDLTTVIEHPEKTIPIKLPYAGKKRGRKPKAK